ncbi:MULTISPECIES: AfsR/SARP family transcriptional regulator [Streptomyces]|uniref:AfsR/SARP family transcriptional regulator n=1 Tax=Streptomyces TaxID=1883 RepID=UPI0019038838|nr:BTAD domain-containing putative transcriptional regulator [Streptomyces sp. XC 2026]QQN77920.1 tetratricopeptide repeat protein [Streptomyces sp. XC 2026]
MAEGKGIPVRTPALRFAVLGPVRARNGETELPTGSPQQRALLAALLLRGGSTATAQQLVDAIWGEQAPQQAVAALRTYASRMRKSLGDRVDVLVSEFGGYALRLGPHDELDLNHMRQLVSRADAAASAGDLDKALELYGTALELWDGEPLAGVPGPDAELHRARLAEEQAVLLENRLDLALQAGLHAESVSELTALTTVHPLRERLRELLMLALYRSGRQAEALAVYADARRILIDQLGVEPRAELSDLQQRILNADASLAQPAEPGSSGPPLVRPAQLPAAVPDFTGRAAFVSELGRQLGTSGGRVMAVSAVAGIGGVGKTTLAVQVAHEAREQFPDGQLYVDLQGSGSAPSDPEAVLGAFLRALGVADSAIPNGVAERSGLFRSLLDGRRVLTLLDNARDAAQVRPLLPGTPGCAALVTSRIRMVDLAGAHLVDLDVMSPEEALTLFTRIVGRERVGAERDAAMDVVAACGFLPLAIRIAAARLASRRTWTVSVLARKLSDERRRLDELQAGDQAVAATFELGYGQLEAEQARAFRLLGLAEGPDISVAAAAALLDREAHTTEDLLESLVDTSLLESAAPGRYRFHDLVRLFARACAERDERSSGEQESAPTRLLDFYLATTAKVFAMERPGDRMVEHLETTHQQPVAFAGNQQALDWLFAEADCLLSAARQVTRMGRVRSGADLLLMARDLAESGTYARQFLLSCEAVLDAAQKSEDALAQGRAHVSLASAYSLSGRFREGDEHAQHAMLLGVVAEDPVAAAHGLQERGIIAHYHGRARDAEEFFHQSLGAFQEDGNQAGEASALSNLSRVQSRGGQSASAVELAGRALSIYQRLNSILRLANGHYALGVALTEDGRPSDGMRELSAALAIFRENRQPLWEGMTLLRQAEALLALEQPAESAAKAEDALAQLRDIGGPWRRAKVLTVLGRGLHIIGHSDRARACWEAALEAFEENGSPEAQEVRNLLSRVDV